MQAVRYTLLFFVSLTSVVIQGTTVPFLAKRLRLILPVKVKRQTHTDLELVETIKSEFAEIRLPADSKAVGKEIVQLGFPKTALISLIKRDGKYITPSGSTILNEGDRLLIVSETKSSLKKAFEVLGVAQDVD